MTDVPGTMLTLCNHTAEHHRRAEAHPFQQQLVRGLLPRPLYLRWLAQMLHIHAALEAHLDRLVQRHPRLVTSFDASRRKVPALRSDLAFLGGDAAEPPLPAARALIERFDRLDAEHSLAFLGAFYVLEGSTNGSKYIARKIRPAYELPATGEGSRYLDPYGDEQPARWQAFKDAMGGVEFTAAEVEELVAVARSTFDAVHDLGGELLAAEPSASGAAA